MLQVKNKYKITEVLNYPVFSDDLNKLDLDKKLVVNTINQYSYCIAETDTFFKEALKQSDILLPDGIGIVLAAKFLKKEKIHKIAGADIHSFLLEKLNEKGGSCFYMGSSQQTLDKIKAKITSEYPNIKVGFYSPPFKKEFSEEDNNKIVSKINSFKPDALFVGMTAPKQEKWVYKLQEKLDAKVICSIGAVFDFYAGTVKRPSKFLQNLGLEWLGRLIKEPKRMFKRYVYYGGVFGYYIMSQKIKKKYI